MKTLAIVIVALWIFGALLYKAADRGGDDFGAGVFAWMFLFIAFICSIVLGGMWVWSLVS